MLVFVWFIAYELENLNVFIHFQNKLRIEDLDIERDRFLHLEKQVHNIFVFTVFIFLAPSLFMIFGYILYSLDEIWDLYLLQNLYQGALVIFAIIVFQSSVMQFLWFTYWHHWLAFQQHIKSLAVIYITIELCLIEMAFY